MCECEDINCPFNVRVMDIQNKNGFAEDRS